MTDLAAPRALLFVPGSAPERFGKAFASAADMVCLDLEDAVAPDRKAAARATVLDAIAGPDGDRSCIRINRLGSVDGMADIVALASAARLPAAIMLPKVESARDVELLCDALPRATAVIALIESARGVEEAFAIARAPGLSALMFGSFDHAADTGSTQDWEALLAARSRLVAAGAAVGKPAIESPYADLTDTDGAALEDARSRRLGMAGRAAIHPRMLPGILAAFTPGEDEVAEARRIVAAFDASEGGAARIGGKLIELPVALRARRLLARVRS